MALQGEWPAEGLHLAWAAKHMESGVCHIKLCFPDMKQRAVTRRKKHNGSGWSQNWDCSGHGTVLVPFHIVWDELALAQWLEVLIVVLLKIHFFWDVTMCHWVSGSQGLEGTTMLWNISNYLSNHATSCHRRRWYSLELQWQITMESFHICTWEESGL